MESKLTQLRNMVASMFENAQEKEQIEKLAQINNAIDEVEHEHEELTTKNGELIKSYKELIKHTSFKEKPDVDKHPTAVPPSLEDSLKEFLASHPEEK